MTRRSGLLRRFRRDQRGVAAVEFALIAPVMVLLYCGLVELCQAMISERKANHVASAVGDLVTQAETVSISDMSDIFSIGSTIMQPFPTTDLAMRVTSITAGSSGTIVVNWSRSSNWTGSSTPTIPAGMSLAVGDSLIVSEAKYKYTSIIKAVIPNALNYSEAFYLRPRRSDKVTCTDC